MTKWISVSDKLPLYDVPVLVVVESPEPRIEISSFSMLGYWSGFDNAVVTHWSDLPTFPDPNWKSNAELPISIDKQNELFNHLRIKFGEERAEAYVFSMAYDIGAFGFGYSMSDCTYTDYLRAEDQANAAYGLYQTCKGSIDLDKYSGHCWALSCDLKKIARDTYQAISPKRGRGRPKTTQLRNELIARIFEYYPKLEKGHKTEGSHFEKTIQMILFMIEPSPPEDVHSVIIRALGAKE